MIRICAFFGNVGTQYAQNRHNAGWLLAEKCQFLKNVNFSSKFRGLYGQLELPTGKVHFIKPATYMNASGESVAELAKFYKVDAGEILVVHDELELPFGTVAAKFSGGLGGHNGLRSMNSVFGTADFYRFRIGIGRPDHDDVAGYVLSDFNSSEMKILSECVLPSAGDLLEKLIVKGPDACPDAFKKNKLN